MFVAADLPTAGTQPDLVRDLIDVIRTESLAVGDRLPSIRALAERFGVTGSTIRDAQIQLQTMGMIKIVPRSGAVVRSVNLAPMVDAMAETLNSELSQAEPRLFHLLDARQLIEVECATEAARRRRTEDLLPIREALNETIATVKTLGRNANAQACAAHFDADMRFHLAIADLAGNPVLTTMLRSVLELLKPYLVRIPWTRKRQQVTTNAHKAMFESLKSGDVDKVRDCMNEYTELARDSLLKQAWSSTVSAP